jgi:hypothetical protein
MKKILIIPFLLSLLGCKDSKVKSEKITIEKIHEMFSHMKAQGVYSDTKMLWGYFFIAKDTASFGNVKNRLKSQNFKFVETFQDDKKNYWLQLERAEIHTPESLYNLNEELYSIAEEYQITYDGFDVGNTDPTKAIERNTYIVPEKFKTADIKKENYLCLITGNTAFDAFPHKKEYKYFIKVTTNYKKDDVNLLPIEGELDSLDNFEQFIENDLKQNKVKTYYVFRDTYKGVRSFYLVTENKTNATKALNLIRNDKKYRQFDFEIIKDEKWKLYEDMKVKLPKD